MTNDTPERKAEDVKEAVQEHWFSTLPKPQRAAIIGPAYEAAHPTDAAKKQARQNYENNKRT